VDLAEKLLFLLDAADLRKKMGEFGRRRVVSELAWEYSEKVLLQAYHSLLLPSAPPGRGT